MKFTYKGHKHNTNVMRWLDSFIFEKPYFKQTMGIVSTHIDGCCDYWTPIDDPRAQRALMLDDDLGLKENPERAKLKEVK